MENVGEKIVTSKLTLNIISKNRTVGSKSFNRMSTIILQDDCFKESTDLEAVLKTNLLIWTICPNI